MNLDASKFLEDLTGRYARLYASAINDLFVAAVTGNRSAASDARHALGETIAETMGVAEVLGASLVLQHAARLLGSPTTQLSLAARGFGLLPWPIPRDLMRFAEEPIQTIIPRVTLQEAVDDMVDRTPATIRRAADRTAKRISQLYSVDRVVAFVRSAEEAVTEAAQNFVARALREGIPAGEAGRALAMTANEVSTRSEPWSEAYSRMAFRTNVNTAVTAGRFRQAQDPDIRAVIPAFRFDAVMDSDVRDNHAAANGIVMAIDNLEWRRIAPPLGYNCRCQVALVSVLELESAGRLRADGSIVESRVPPDAFPDPDFRYAGRPDLMISELA